MATEFFSTGAYLLYLGSLTAQPLRSSTSSTSKPRIELGGLVLLAHGLELEAEEAPVAVVCQLPEDRTVVEEVLEDPAACCLEYGDSLALGEHVKGVGLQGEASGE